jgi:hypothetical protein
VYGRDGSCRGGSIGSTIAKPPKQRLTHVEDEQLRALKARFDAAHAAGVAALARGDHVAAGKAIRLQREILDDQRNLLVFKLQRVKAGR